SPSCSWKGAAHFGPQPQLSRCFAERQLMAISWKRPDYCDQPKTEPSVLHAVVGDGGRANSEDKLLAIYTQGPFLPADEVGRLLADYSEVLNEVLAERSGSPARRGGVGLQR